MNRLERALFATLWTLPALLMPVAAAIAQAPPPPAPRMPEARLLEPREVQPGEVVGFHPRVHGDWIGVGGSREADGVQRGSLHLFARRDGAWRHAQRLVSPAPGRGGDAFGAQIALGPDTLAVGDFVAEHDGQVVGAVHLYALVDGTWQPTQTLHMSAPRERAGFGAALDLDGDTLVVGEAEALAIGGWGDNRALHVFERKDGRWRPSATIERPESLQVAAEKREKAQAEQGTARHAGFGAHFDLDGDRLAVSAMGADALLLYRRTEGAWRLVQRIDDPGEDAGFARTVAFAGDTLVVAALRGKGRVADTGVAHVYREAEGRWSLAQTLSLPNGQTLDMFGHWVAADPDTILVGAQMRLMNAGLAYAYRRTDAGWALDAVLNPPEAWRRRMTAYALDLDAHTAVLSPGNELLAGGPLQPPGPGGVYVVDLAPPPAAAGGT
ncbi:MAG: hypothetical protein LW860_00870 [Xanthomonadaceae bacterium]|jgi:hypothetical protein|nr:hypothetical protein [Xanthomonadaceae bacterium]